MTKQITTILITILVLFPGICPVYAQVDITLEDIFQKGVFSKDGVYGINWMKDGRYYSTLEKEGGAKVVRVNLETGEREEVVVDGNEIGLQFSGYSFNEDESKLLLSSEVESIYRRSTKGVYHVFDRETQELQPLYENEKVSYATLSPDNTKVAFVKDNNLYYKDLKSGELHQVTLDGKENHIINGAADWVYEEEFSMAQAFKWSPDGKKIAFLRFDESEVPAYNMQLWGELYPQDYIFKYPKAGEKNAVVGVHIHHLDGETVIMDSGEEEDVYLPRIFWAGNSDTLAFIRLNRLQNQMDLYHADSRTGNSQLLLSESSSTYVDLNYNDNLLYLDNGKGIISTSEKDGFKHIYHHDLSGNLIRQITSGDWEVTELIGIDQDAGKIYFHSTEVSPLQTHLFVVDMKGENKKQLTKESGTHQTDMSPDFKYYIGTFSNTETPDLIRLFDTDGLELTVLENNSRLKERLENFNLGSKEFFEMEAADGSKMNGYLIKPHDFDPAKKYPVLMYVYGGPGSQNVKDSWTSIRDFWHFHLAGEGYLVACVDNRGTGAKGREFKHATYANLGKLEVEDQIDAAKYMGTLPYVDPERIGIWGWSYGGYMSSLSLMLGNEVFKTAIAVAPVTTWRYYDTIYTERYLQTPQLNPSGYDDNSPLTHVGKLEGSFLLIHGTGDDNVHFQNAVDLTNALIGANKQFETFYYPNRAHSISGGNTSFHLYRKMTDFIKKSL
ncbi:S9 family peptidase [Pleomorphovibrio marinus]|uniref:S9 family peptidase n=1 Tax=Pleomorphovibrio marinus TaxID=2164132 RepID=UPI000E0A2F23|nr:S9 family peptidase [Pleomorphovibrio marinus]